jgi:hypothetical protein
MMGRESVPWPTRTEADRILWTLKAGVPEIVAYGVAMFYLMREARQDSTRDLDWFIAFRPWLSHEIQEDYGDVMGHPELEVGLWFLLDLYRKIQDEYQNVQNERELGELMGHQDEAKEVKEEANG